MGTRHKAPFLTLAVAVAIMLGASAAMADGVRGDADNDALSSPTLNSVTRNQQVGTTQEYPFSILVNDTAPASNNVFANPGDTVHVASRLEALTKEYQCELVVSERVLSRAGLAGADYPRHELTVRNREAPLRIAVVAEARGLVEQIPADHARADG